MSRNKDLFKRARCVIPGGVNSPVRAFKSVSGEPPFIKKGEGPYIYDEEGKRYIDCVLSWGPLILGHAHPEVVEAVVKAARDGMTFGAPTEREVVLAETVAACMPWVEKVRLVSSGTEATMSAIRLARAFTGRDKIVKFEGCYHGHADSFLIKAGSGALTHGHPSSPGVTQGTAADTLNAVYNDLDSVEAIFQENKRQIAAVIVEPIAGNMGVVLPEPTFLPGLRKWTEEYGALLIFDEVITGFRIGLGGAQGHYGVRPDLTTLGKILGGGLPLGAFGGRKEIMDKLAPEGPVYQAGTLSGNPLATAAGLATLALLQRPGFYETLNGRGKRFFSSIASLFQSAAFPVAGNHIASLGTLFFGIPQAKGYADITKADTERYARFHAAMLEQGVYLAPSQFEAVFVSMAHTDGILDEVLKIMKEAVAKLWR